MPRLTCLTPRSVLGWGVVSWWAGELVAAWWWRGWDHLTLPHTPPPAPHTPTPTSHIPHYAKVMQQTEDAFDGGDFAAGLHEWAALKRMAARRRS